MTLKSETKFDDFLLHDPDFLSKTAFGLHYVYRSYRYITRYVNQYYNILKIYSKCGVRVTFANKRNTFINESHFSDSFFKTHHCVHEIITLAIRAQFALTFRPTLLSNF